MRTNAQGIALIKVFESCSLTAYRGIDDRWTMGWGRARGISEGDQCTQAIADQWLEEDIAECERLVLNCIYVQLTDNQLSALVSFVFNVGLGYKGIKDGFFTLVSGSPSTMLKYLRLGDFARVAEEFPKWDKVGGQPCDGIYRRRMAEQMLFLTPPPETPPKKA